VTQYTNARHAKYNGLTLTSQRRLSSALTFMVNYTCSRAVDIAFTPD